MTATDERLREIERAAQAGDPGAWVALLRERVRLWVPSVLACRHCEGSAEVSGFGEADRPDSRNGKWGMWPCPDCNGTGRAPYREAVRLAAYLSYQPAYEVLGEPLGTPFGQDGSWLPGALDFGVWLKGLSRWGDGVMLRAAVAAARAVFEVEVAACSWCNRYGQRHAGTAMCERHYRAAGAIEAAERYLADPSEANLRLWR